MRVSGWGSRGAAVLLVGLGLSGCATSGLNVSAGPLPEGADYTGVWYSTEYGELHLIDNGASVQGRFTKDERKGTISGQTDGDLLTFEWIEKKAMVANRPQETRGHGYFKYVIKENGDHQLNGRWGLNADYSSGGAWENYKMKGRSPELTQGGSSSGFEGADDSMDDDDGFGDADDSLDDL